ncbi:MAG: hypothetical protein MRERV_34c022 [Mycoplasmataceae bacterium RV_VA103A]|nr:MAG: hypothetical protein MRERV_34c022 [Mycoplasmataceae bacterium RV_VA103A]
MKVNKSNTNKEVIRKPTKKIDGRSATRTGRIVQFATSVTVGFDNTIRQLARDDGLMIVEILEKSLSLYKEQRERERERAKSTKKKGKIIN